MLVEVTVTVVGVVLVVAYISGTIGAYVQQVKRFLDDWADAPSSTAVPPPRRWTEAQLFEPVSKWVDDAERAVVAADTTRADAPARACRHCQDGGIVADGLCRPCYMQSRRRLPGFSDGGYVVRSGTGQVVRYTGSVWDGTVRAEWTDGREPKPLS